MLYLFSGDDTKNKIISYERFIKSIPESTETFFINRNDFNKAQIENFYSSSALFSSLSSIIFSNILEYEEIRDFILDKLKLMEKSSSSFIFLEGKLNKPILDAFKKVLSMDKDSLLRINIFELSKEKKEKFDNWLLPNAFLAKDKLNLWIYFRQAVDKGVVMEELIGVLFWKMKDALLRKNFSKFSEEELKDFIARLSYLLPEARKKGLDAESVFEQFLLEAF
ncbi:MAG: hypothetical protein WC884_03330 [Candidatus Paceibacterota bacterium]